MPAPDRCYCFFGTPHPDHVQAWMAFQEAMAERAYESWLIQEERYA